MSIIKERDEKELLGKIKSQISEEKYKLLTEIYESIQNHYNYKISLIQTEEEIKNKLETLKPIQDEKLHSFYIEFISILIRVCELKFQIKPRNIQIISLLLFILKEKNEGIIEEISTGEGKSLIITFLATIKAFLGNKVDILTSSPILAERDAKKMKNFYDIFGITVDYCNGENKYNEISNTRPYYKADICYGDELSFEGDILRSEFLGLTGRGDKRGFDCIIIDEIDNICLDNIKNMTELVDNFKGYKYLEYCYLFVFNELLEIEKEYIGNNLKYKKSQKKEIIEKLYNKVLEEFEKFPSCIIIQKYIKDNYIKFKIKKWCELAYDANFNYKKNKDYIVTKDKELNFEVIKPIDYANTGIIEENTVWAGLHQFLQIKEHLRLTEENLNSCFMSNLTFFKKYIKYKNNSDFNCEIIENNIFGLTGTLGTEISQNALKTLYNLKLIFIPSFKQNQLKIEQPQIFSDYTKYKEKLKDIILEVAIKQERAVLVILRYIDNVDKLKLILSKDTSLKDNIITYARSDIIEEKAFLNNEIQPKNIIISTNLSGRGTDLKISKEVEKNGGLHVILTFVPKSERIERQAFGRAARKGERGSAQYVIYRDGENESFDKILEERVKYESNEYKYLIDVYQKKVFLFEKFFERFSAKLKMIRKSQIKNNDYKKAILEDVKERWALFLVQNDLSHIEKHYKDEESLNYSETEFKKTEENFEIFMNKLEKDTISLDNYSFVNKLLFFELDDCNYKELIPISPVGACLNIIRKELFKKEKNYKKKIIGYFKELLRYCNMLNRQVKYISDKFPNIQMENTDLKRQFKDKKDYIADIINFTKKNIKVLDESKNKTVVPEFYSIMKDNKFTKDIYLYYYDLGIFFFNLKVIEEGGFLSFIKKIFN